MSAIFVTRLTRAGGRLDCYLPSTLKLALGEYSGLAYGSIKVVSDKHGSVLWSGSRPVVFWYHMDIARATIPKKYVIDYRLLGEETVEIEIESFKKFNPFSWFRGRTPLYPGSAVKLERNGDPTK